MLRIVKWTGKRRVSVGRRFRYDPHDVAVVTWNVYDGATYIKTFRRLRDARAFVARKEG